MNVTTPSKARAVEKYLTKDKTVMYLTRYNMTINQLAVMFGVQYPTIVNIIQRLHIDIEKERIKYKESLPKEIKRVGMLRDKYNGKEYSCLDFSYR
jgi:hypothetical protein